jgi:hypothetical protein
VHAADTHLCGAVTENFKRREYIADVMAQMKAPAVSVYWAHRDWNRGCPAGGAPHAPKRPALPAPPQLSRSSSLFSHAAPPQQLSAQAQNALDVLREFLVNVRGYVMADDGDQAVVDAYFARALRSLSTLHVLNEVLCDAAGYSKGGEGGISRVTQFTRFLLLQLEQLKIMRLYAGVPHGLRVFVAFMCATTPVLLAPYFRNFCAAADATAGRVGIKRLTDWSGADPCVPGYFAAAMYCVVVCTLYAVLTEIEDLYDGNGLDDIHVRPAAPHTSACQRPEAFVLTPAPRAVQSGCGAGHGRCGCALRCDAAAVRRARAGRAPRAHRVRRLLGQAGDDGGGGGGRHAAHVRAPRPHQAAERAAERGGRSGQPALRSLSLLRRVRACVRFSGQAGRGAVTHTACVTQRI